MKTYQLGMKEINLDCIKLDTIPIINPSVISRETADNGLILVNCDTGGSLALNSTGKMIWNLINGKRNSEEIIQRLSTYFEEVPESITVDVTSTLLLLSDEGLIGYEIKI